MIDHPYWWDTVADPPPAPPPRLPVRVDVAVIGGGYTGLSAARQLARQGASVVVLERERIGWGASSRNGGQVLTGLKLDAATLVARYGESRARALFERSLESIAFLERVIDDESIACDYERCGHLQAAAKPAHFRAFRDEQALLARVFDHRVELVSSAEQRSEVGTGVYHGVLVDERSGALNPARYASGLAAAAARAGATLADRVAVTGLVARGGPWIVTTDRGDVHASDVLVATNGYTGPATPRLERRLVPVGSYIIATAPLGAADAAALLPRRRMAFDSKHFLHYFRVTADRRLLFGGRAEFSRPSPGATRRAAATLHRDLARVFPQLAGTAIEYAWSGNVAMTRDQMPHAGRMEGAYFAAGYCGHGVAMATYLGSLVARRIAGDRTEHPLLDDRMPSIPLYRGRPWFLPLVGAYYRFQDFIH